MPLVPSPVGPSPVGPAPKAVLPVPPTLPLLPAVNPPMPSGSGMVLPPFVPANPINNFRGPIDYTCPEGMSLSRIQVGGCLMAWRK